MQIEQSDVYDIVWVTEFCVFLTRLGTVTRLWLFGGFKNYAKKTKPITFLCLLGLSISCSATFNQLFWFRATFRILSYFLLFWRGFLLLASCFHNCKAPIEVLILDIGCFHYDIYESLYTIRQYPCSGEYGW